MKRKIDIHWYALIALLLMLAAAITLYVLGYGEDAAPLLAAALGLALPQAVRRAPDTEPRISARARRQRGEQ